MDKRRAIQIMTKTAQLYREHLEDQKVFVSVWIAERGEKAITGKRKDVVICAGI